MVKLAVPLTSGRFPEIAVEPSKKTTKPVAVAGLTLAVKLNALPNTEGLVPALKSTVTVVGLFTVCDNGGDVDPLKVASPLYCAVMEWVPTGNDEIVRLADP